MIIIYYSQSENSVEQGDMLMEQKIERKRGGFARTSHSPESGPDKEKHFN